MLGKLTQLWQDKGFEILVGVSIVVILLLALFRIGKKGSWAKSYTYVKDKKQHDHGDGQRSSRGPPKDSKGELECRRVLQEVFKQPFDKARPDFLRNPVTGNNFNLELDCYCAELRLAVEYSGAQHYKFIPFFHRNKDAFLNQKYRDDMKKRMCKENGITLIEVPYTVKHDDIRNFLIEKFYALGYLQ